MGLQRMPVKVEWLYVCWARLIALALSKRFSVYLGDFTNPEDCVKSGDES